MKFSGALALVFLQVVALFYLILLLPRISGHGRSGVVGKLAEDNGFLAYLERVRGGLAEYLAAKTWYAVGPVGACRDADRLFQRRVRVA